MLYDKRLLNRVSLIFFKHFLCLSSFSVLLMQQLMAETSSWLPLVIVTILLFITVIVNLFRYGNIKTQPWFVSLTCIVGWFFPFWIIILLPLDLASVS